MALRMEMQFYRAAKASVKRQGKDRSPACGKRVRPAETFGMQNARRVALGMIVIARCDGSRALRAYAGRTACRCEWLGVDSSENRK